MAVEADLAKFTRKALKDSGLLWWRVANQGTIHNGVRKKSEIAGFPDFAGVTKDGQLFCLELKSPTGKCSPEQLEWLRRLDESGCLTMVARSEEDVMNFILILCDEEPNTEQYFT